MNAQSNDSHCDVAIVGGGVIGSAVAYFLAASEGFSGTVQVIEKDLGYQECSTGRSVGGVRQQFSTPENIAISRFTVDFVKHVDSHLSVDGESRQRTYELELDAFLATIEGRQPRDRPVSHELLVQETLSRACQAI